MSEEITLTVSPAVWTITNESVQGWTPVLAVVDDSGRRVQQVVDWTGGAGIKPAVGKYIGTVGFVDTAAAAVDVRGAAGTQGLQGAAGKPGQKVPKGVADFDSSISAQQYMYRVIPAGSITKTANVLRINYASNHGLMDQVLMAITSDETAFEAHGQAQYKSATSMQMIADHAGPDGVSTQPAKALVLSCNSSVSWWRHVIEDPELAGRFQKRVMVSRAGRVISQVIADLPMILGLLGSSPLIVIGGLSVANGLLVPAPDTAGLITSFDQVATAVLNAGHYLAITNIKPADQTLSIPLAPPTSAQVAAGFAMNRHFNELAEKDERISIIDWRSALLNPASTTGAAKLNLHADDIHYNPAGAIVAAVPVGALLKALNVPASFAPLRFGRDDGPQWGTGIGANLTDALADLDTVAPSGQGAGGTAICRDFNLTGTGSGRLSSSSVVQLTDRDLSYKQVIQMQADLDKGWMLSLVGPAGELIKDRLVAGGVYRFACRYSLTSLVSVKSFAIEAQAAIVHNSLGAVSGICAAAVTQRGDLEQTTPGSYGLTTPLVDRIAQMEFVMPTTMTSCTAFQIYFEVMFNANAGSCTLAIDSPTLRRIG